MSFHPNDIARRGQVASMLLLGALGFLLINFFNSQVLHNEQWSQRSEEQHYRRLPIPAPRGRILDRNGKVIAESAVAHSVSFLASDSTMLIATMDQLNTIVPIKPEEKKQALKRFRSDKGARPTVIFTDAQFDKVSVLEEHRLDFPSLVIQETPKRWYPAGEAVGAFVGYTGEIKDTELRTKKDSGYLTGQQIGRTGLEEQYEQLLRGMEGASVVEVDAHMRVVSGENARLHQKPVPGKTLQTTIDLDLQQFAHDLFADSAIVGAIVAMEPQTGDVLALYSSPNVDPNRWIGGIAPAFYDSINTDPRKPLYNKAIQGRYPPGSTFKLATAIMALQAGLIKPTDRMPQQCTGSYSIGGSHTWRCWEPGGHGSLDLIGAIQKSCDVYFYQLGQKLAISRLVAGGVDLGFASKTGLDLPGENRPDFPRLDSARSVKAYYDQKFQPGRWTAKSEELNLAIGQGSNSQTVISMARFYAALANGGMAPTPHIGVATPVLTPLFKLEDADMRQVNDAMVGVLAAGGTAAASAIRGVTVAGKTGTAQSGTYVNGTELNHAWFTGFAPAASPRIVVAVMWEFGGHGSRVAHIATMVMEHYLHLALRPVTVTGE